MGFVLLLSVILYLLGGKKKIDVKTAAISSLINQEEDNYRPIVLSA